LMDRRGASTLPSRRNGGTPGSAAATLHPPRPGARGQSSGRSPSPMTADRWDQARQASAALLGAEPFRVDLADPAVDAVPAGFRGHGVTRLPVGAVLEDPVAVWIRLDKVARRLIGRRREHGPTPQTDAELDKLMLLRAWTAQRLVN
jgi:hypothetical protein